MRMFNKILSYFDLGIKIPSVSKEEKAFNDYLDWLLSLELGELEVKLEYSRRYDGPTMVEFLTKVIAKKKKLLSPVKVRKSNNYEKKVGYTERSERMVRFIVDSDREAAIGDNLKDITPDHTHPSPRESLSKIDGKDGKFDGEGASGDWDRSPSTSDIVNAAPRVYTTGIEDHTSKGRPFTDYERNHSRNHVPNPVYHTHETTYHPPTASCPPDTGGSSDSCDSGGSSSCSSD